MSIRIVSACIALAILTAIPCQTIATEDPAQSKYDAELAKKLGADEHGMRSYVLVILKTGPNDASIKGEERQEIFKGHFANMNRLAEQGNLVVAGPFGENEQAFRGLFVLAVPTVEEARKLAETDPAVKAGIFVVDYLPWYGSAALMQTNEIHQRIVKSGI